LSLELTAKNPAPLPPGHSVSLICLPELVGSVTDLNGQEESVFFLQNGIPTQLRHTKLILAKNQQVTSLKFRIQIFQTMTS
jgi:hypothetical protein